MAKDSKLTETANNFSKDLNQIVQSISKIQKSMDWILARKEKAIIKLSQVGRVNSENFEARLYDAARELTSVIRTEERYLRYIRLLFDRFESNAKSLEKVTSGAWFNKSVPGSAHLTQAYLSSIVSVCSEFQTMLNSLEKVNRQEYREAKKCEPSLFRNLSIKDYTVGFRRFREDAEKEIDIEKSVNRLLKARQTTEIYGINLTRAWESLGQNAKKRVAIAAFFTALTPVPYFLGIAAGFAGLLALRGRRAALAAQRGELLTN